ncbi:MAG: hypothetical protein WCL50_07845 [Spirochaetota bacterium]
MEHEIGEKVIASLKLKIAKLNDNAESTIFNLPMNSNGVIVDIQDEDYIVEWVAEGEKIRSKCYYEYIKIIPDKGLCYCVSFADYAL